MKLEFGKITVERSSNFKSERFDIGDVRVIMEILRGKIYSNPILTICQEIMSNAVDAHREVGKEAVPIEVKLPNKLEPYFWIRDFGPGIEPERMSTVFIMYGISTKRKSNKERGGFGLGCKSPFSYTDTFIVVSITPENGVMIKREYIAHIDESGMGEMSQVKEEVTDEPQGTTIVISPKEEGDFDRFKEYVRRTATHWAVKPTILGDPEWEWPSYQTIYKGKKWEIHQNSPLGNAPYALIDGIPYRFELKNLYPKNMPPLVQRLKSIPLRLFFDIGEIPVTANREDIDYQSKVISRLQARVSAFIEEAQENISDDLKKQSNLQEAIVYWQKLKRKPYGFLLSTATWNGLSLSDYETVNFGSIPGVEILHFRKDSETLSGCRKQGESLRISIREKCLLVENDIKKKTLARNRLATLFDREEVSYVALVTFSRIREKVTGKDGNPTVQVKLVDEKVITERKIEADKKCKWSLFAPIKLSSITPKVYEPREKKVRPKSVKIKKLVIKKVKHYYRTRTEASWEAAEQGDIDKHPIRYYAELSGSGVYLKKPHNRIKLRRLIDFMQAMDTFKKGIAIFGVLPSHVSKLDNTWIPFYNYAEETFESAIKSVPKGSRSSYTATSKLNNNSWNLLKDKKYLDKIKGTLLHDYFMRSLEIENASNQIKHINALARFINKSVNYNESREDKKIQKLYTDVINRYPLLGPIFSTYFNLSSCLDDLVDYVNMKDKEYKINEEI
jgi:tetratricopeptide (TPR) repeat protein